MSGSILRSTASQALAQAESFAALRNLVDKAEVRLSFWGYHYVCVQGCGDSLSLDDLAARATEIIRRNPQFNEDERSHGKVLAPKITAIYDRSDELLNQSNLFTRLLWILRGIPDFFAEICNSRDYSCSVTRWYWSECKNNLFYTPTDQIFEYYTRQQYLNKFGTFPTGTGSSLFRAERWKEQREREETALLLSDDFRVIEVRNPAQQT